MKPRWKMLLWEQWRTAGMLCLFIGAITVVLMLGIYSQIPLFRMHVHDVPSAQGSVILGMLLMAGLVLILRQDTRAHLTLDFEPRLLRLPVHAAPVAMIVFVIRLLFLFLLGTALYLFYGALYGALPPLAYLALPLNLFLWAQTFAWSRTTITGLSYAIPAALLSLCLVLLAWGLDMPSLVAAGTLAVSQFTRPLSLGYSIPATFGLAWLSIYWRSRDERHGLPPAGEVYDWLRAVGAVHVRTFATPFDAQLWYEQRRIGRLLPLLTALFTIAFILLFAAFPDMFPRELRRLWLMPNAGLGMAALVTGAIALRPRDRYVAMRPHSPTFVSMALLLVQLRSVLLCILLVAALSTLLLLLHGYDGVLITAMLIEGHLDWLGAALLILRPAFAAAIIAWALLWASTRVMFLPTMGIFAVALAESRLFRLFRRYPQFRMEDVWLQYLMLFVLLAVVVSMLIARSRGLLSWKQLLVLLLLQQNIALLLLVASPYLGAHYIGISITTFIAALVVVPFCAAPLSFKRRMRSR